MKKMSLSLCTFLAAAGMFAQTTFEVNKTTYTVTGENEVELTKGDTKVTTLVLPSKVTFEDKEYTVTSIGENAYRWSEATSIKIPGTVKVIGHGAFSSCSASELTLEEGIEIIGSYAFSSHKIVNLEIPSTVKRIKESAFFGSSSTPTLQSLTLHDGLKVIENSAFYGNAIVELEIPASVDSLNDKAFLYSGSLEKLTLNEGLVYIGEGVFNNSNYVIKNRNTTLTEVKLPSTLKSIGREGFFHMPLTSLHIPANLESIGIAAFGGCKIQTITVDANSKYMKMQDGLLYSKDNRILYQAPIVGVGNVKVNKNCLGINGGAFWGSDLTSIELPEGLLAIGYGAFYETPISSIKFPSTLTYIEDQAFAMTQLTDVVLPENLECVNQATFYMCPKLKTVTIPSGVQGIDLRAFYGCDLSTVTCKGSFPCKLADAYEGEEIFTGSPKLIVPKGCRSTYRADSIFYRPTMGKYENLFSTYFTIIQESEEGVLQPISTTPANGDAFEKYQTYLFKLTFDENISIANNNFTVFVRPNGLEYSPEETPDEWKISIEADGKTAKIWGEDSDGYTYQSYPKGDKIYFIVIPAGIIKNAAGDKNEQIIIWCYSNQDLKDKVEGVNDIDDIAFSNTDDKEVARYSIDGKKLNAPKQGINIVKYANGSAVKTFVK